jgi:hypothetical protein
MLIVRRECRVRIATHVGESLHGEGKEGTAKRWTESVGEEDRIDASRPRAERYGELWVFVRSILRNVKGRVWRVAEPLR